ncbi:MAG: OmpA family protein [Treponema sp.]|nr:OmpA family protein [Treponema sp.]
MKKKLIFAGLLFCAAALFSEGVVLRYKHNLDDACSYVSKVYEDVYFDGMLNHSAVIGNRISARVTHVYEDGSASILARYMVNQEGSVSNQTGAMTWGEESESIFIRRPTGEMEIGSSAFLPSVRNVPVFPTDAVKPGDTWSGRGTEAEDLRASFNLDKPYLVPFIADYKYLRDDEIDGRTFQVISVSYSFYYESPAKKVNDVYLPKYTQGNCTQIIWWDNEKGFIDHYSDNFRIEIMNYAGNSYIMVGNSEAQITEFVPSTQETLQKIQETVDNLELEDVSVTQTDKGLSISLENIQFLPDSAILMDSEKAKLKKIAEILKEFPNDLLIKGHCADRGTEKNRQIISEERADAVADFLFNQKVRTKDRMFTKGVGSKEPAAPNTTEEGRRKNRRVEIIILE